MEKSVKDGKPWNYGLLEYRVTPISGNLLSPLEALTGNKPRTSLPQIPSSVGKSIALEGFARNFCEDNQALLTNIQLKPGQPVFMKEVTENVWKTDVINQPAMEPESYWIKFPDNSILRRMRSMIKPRSQPFYFQLEAEGKEWKHTGTIPPHYNNPLLNNLSNQIYWLF